MTLINAPISKMVWTFRKHNNFSDMPTHMYIQMYICIIWAYTIYAGNLNTLFKL